MTGLFTEPGSCERLPVPDAEILLWHHFISPDESRDLMHSLLEQTPWQQDVITIAGRKIPVPRLQAWYGDEHSFYAYSGISLRPLPWTPLLSGLKQRIEARAGQHFNSVLLNQYRHGQDSVSWHADDEPELGSDPVIASLSLGASREFRLRHRQQATICHCSLEDGSLLIMGSGTQGNYQHQVPKEKHVTGTRLNLTFRQVMNGATNPA